MSVNSVDYNNTNNVYVSNAKNNTEFNGNAGNLPSDTFSTLNKKTENRNTFLNKLMTATLFITGGAFIVASVISKKKFSNEFNEFTSKFSESVKTAINKTFCDYRFDDKKTILKNLQNIKDVKKFEQGKISDQIRKIAKDKKIKSKSEEDLFDKIFNTLDDLGL